MEKFDVNQFKGCTIGTIWSFSYHEGGDVVLCDEHNKEYRVSTDAFVGLITRNKVLIKDNKFELEMVIGNDLCFYTVTHFLDWTNFLTKMKQLKINYEDLKVGVVYQANDLVSNYVYLGKRWVIKWQHNRKGKKIELTKLKQEHIFYEVYAYNKFGIGSPTEFNYKTFKNKTLISEVGFKGEKVVNLLLNYYVEHNNVLYFEEVKPKGELNLYLKKIDINYLYELRDELNISFKNIFHKQDNYLILNHYFISSNDNRTWESNAYARQISKSDYDEVVFKEPFNNEVAQVDDKTPYYCYNSTLARITTKCSNDYFVLAPDNYYILSLE